MNTDDLKVGIPMVIATVVGALWGAFAAAWGVPLIVFYLVTFALGSSIALGSITASAIGAHIKKK